MSSKATRKAIGAAAVLLVGGAATAVVALAQNGAEATDAMSVGSTSTPSTGQTATSSTDAATPTSTATPKTTAKYRNGTYRATGSYSSPGGAEQIGVTVTIAHDTVTKLKLDTSTAQGTAAQFQELFAQGIDALVVGKKLDDVSVSRVSGSSLTSTGFNEAIATIRSHAGD